MKRRGFFALVLSPFLLNKPLSAKSYSNFACPQCESKSYVRRGIVTNQTNVGLAEPADPTVIYANVCRNCGTIWKA